MLTLDHTTLFYWTLSAQAEYEADCHVKDWSLRVPLHAKPASRPNSGNGSHQTKSRNSTVPPSIFSSNPSTRTSGTSILTSTLKITEVKAEQLEIVINDAGGLSDFEEMEGIKRDAAIASPFKKGSRATSSVSDLFTRCYTNI